MVLIEAIVNGDQCPTGTLGSRLPPFLPKPAMRCALCLVLLSVLFGETWSEEYRQQRHLASRPVYEKKEVEGEPFCAWGPRLIAEEAGRGKHAWAAQAFKSQLIPLRVEESTHSEYFIDVLSLPQLLIDNLDFLLEVWPRYLESSSFMVSSSLP